MFFLMFVRPFICLLARLCERLSSDFHETLYGKNLLNYGVDPAQNGGLAAILVFRYIMFM